MAKKARRLRRMVISEISLVDHPANRREFDFVKRYDSVEDFDLNYARALDAIRDGRAEDDTGDDGTGDDEQKTVNIEGFATDLADGLVDVLTNREFPTAASHFGRELAQAAAEGIQAAAAWTGVAPDPDKTAGVVAAAVDAVLDTLDE